MSDYIFHRAEGFYVIDIPDDMLAIHGEAKCIADNASCNPGTLKVEDMAGETIWQMEPAL